MLQFYKHILALIIQHTIPQMTKKNALFYASIIVFLFCSCSGPVQQTESQPALTTVQADLPATSTIRPFPPTNTKTAETTGTATPTHPPTTKPTLRPSRTASVRIEETPTPTYSLLPLRTNTSAPPALCPETSSQDAPPPSFLHSDEFFFSGYLERQDDVIGYLNTFGPQPIVYQEERQAQLGGYESPVLWQDLTNDGVPEFALRTRTFDIFGCYQGNYITFFSQPTIDAYLTPYKLVNWADNNRNGLPELTFLSGFETQGGRSYEVFEWDGNEFQSLIPNEPYQPYLSLHAKNSGIEYRDLDGDYIKELIATVGIPVWEIYYSGLPWRNESRYFRWNGVHYVYAWNEYDPPEYRFQAVQDADLATERGNYERAIELYREAIFSDLLEWWSPERRTYYQVLFGAELAMESTPTPIAPETNEYYQLSAYARFRILVLYTFLGWDQEARIIFDEMLEKYPLENPGFPYIEMAKAFIEEYEDAGQINLACSRAIDYATSHPEVLIPLGSEYHGWQSHIYAAQDVCIFH